MSAGARVIRTPDQRLRIFVSSTLKELAPERRAARAAVERLHLAPVMFELGARPHPPRELYRAYLEQCDVFVGIYWERYGWVAPDEEVSGLEDEYNLCPVELPRLLYIKDPAENREPRLKVLLDRIRADDRTSFKYFESAEELAVLLESDLATLLAERFELSRAQSAEPPAAPADREGALPAPLTELIGRERELADLERMLAGGTRLVTITGPGGIGKSRLSIAAAKALAPRFPDGAVFIDLSAVHDAATVPNTVAQTIGVRDTGDVPITEKLVTALRDRRMLLVLDNFEQVLDAAPSLSALLSAAPGVSVIVTSRSLLHIGGEHSFALGPLVGEPATALFVERAHAVKPDFEITTENAEAVVRICEALDGVPLALELAAARIRVLSAPELLERLDRRLSLLVGGARDLPQRQRTLRSTIEWSTQLLSETERRLLACLGVFEGGFTLEAAEFVVDAAARDEGAAVDTLGDIAALVDSSLLSQQDTSDRPRFTMLATVREYALEQLTQQGGLEGMRELHARYYLQLGDRVELELEGAQQRDWVRRLDEESDNLRAVIRYLLDRRDWGRAAHLAWALYVYWWVAGHLGEVRGWMQEVLSSGDELDHLTRALALYFTLTIGFWQVPDREIVAGLTESAELFHRVDEQSGEALALISLSLVLLAAEKPDTERADDAMEASLGLFRASGDAWGESLALVMLGRVALLRQHVHRGLNRFEESLVLARSQGDELGETIALHHRGWARLLIGEVADAAGDFSQCLAISARLGHVEGIAYALEGMVAVAALAGDVNRAGRLLGASRSLRERSGENNAAAFSFHQRYVDQLAASGAREALDVAIGQGRTLTVEEVVAEAQQQPVPAETRPEATP
ncbi:ATP-binding protein [Leifsonia sp. NPDC058248]|uniref:ATP-binding protein n=1 Tax=Leifsonia sp. NPDC058248 TaxID=3346402 RepID=UPI0036DB3F05